MADSSRELFNLGAQILSYVSLFVTLGAAVIALVKLKTTPAGILMATGLGGLFLILAAMKGVRFALGTSSPATSMTLSIVSSLLQMLATIVFIAGLALIPSSLEKLAKRG